MKILQNGNRQDSTPYMKRLIRSLSSTNDGAFIIDRHHRIVFWNQAAEEILGYTNAEVGRMQCYEILGGRDEQGRTLCQRFCRMVIQADRGDVLPNQDIFVHTKMGTGCWLNVTAFTYLATDNTIGQVIVHLFRDVTESKNYQRFINQLLDAFERLQQNGTYEAISFAPAKPTGNGLTAREWQVLGLMAHGLGTGEMADSMTISPTTVRNHIQKILSKLGVHSRLEAIAYAYQRGLIESNGI